MISTYSATDKTLLDLFFFLTKGNQLDPSFKIQNRTDHWSTYWKNIQVYARAARVRMRVSHVRARVENIGE